LAAALPRPIVGLPPRKVSRRCEMI